MQIISRFNRLFSISFFCCLPLILFYFCWFNRARRTTISSPSGVCTLVPSLLTGISAVARISLRFVHFLFPFVFYLVYYSIKEILICILLVAAKYASPPYHSSQTLFYFICINHSPGPGDYSGGVQQGHGSHRMGGNRDPSHR